jgi:hypothetical protein
MQTTENRELRDVLKSIDKHLAPLTIEHLSAEEKDLAFDVKIAQTALGDVIEFDARRHGLSADEYLRHSLKPKPKLQTSSIAELAGGQTN